MDHAAHEREVARPAAAEPTNRPIFLSFFLDGPENSETAAASARLVPVLRRGGKGFNILN